MGRRFRPGVLYCINNCLWEIEATLDLDGFGTGNGKNSLNTATSSILQRGAVNFHAENLHPWLPTVQFGMEVQNAGGGSLARQGQERPAHKPNTTCTPVTTASTRPCRSRDRAQLG